MTELSETNFEQEVLKAGEPVLVDFSAPWCGPCKMLTPVIHELADEMEGVKIAEVNIDNEPALAQQYAVMSVPTLLFFKDGKVMDQMVGVQSKSDIQNALEKLKA